MDFSFSSSSSSCHVYDAFLVDLVIMGLLISHSTGICRAHNHCDKRLGNGRHENECSITGQRGIVTCSEGGTHAPASSNLTRLPFVYFVSHQLMLLSSSTRIHVYVVGARFRQATAQITTRQSLQGESLVHSTTRRAAHLLLD